MFWKIIKLTKKLFKITLFLAVFFMLAAFSGVLGERIIMPFLSTKEPFSKYSFFQKFNEKVTVINKTEQVVVREEFNIADVAQGIVPGVVSIVSVEKGGNSSLTKLQSGIDSWNSSKTGFFLTSDGLVVSALAENEKSSNWDPTQYNFWVFLDGGQKLEAQFWTKDSFSDLVFYKVEGGNFPAVVLANSDELKIGEKVVVVGKPDGEYQNSFSTGIIRDEDKNFSLVNSKLSSSERLEGVVLTDAKIDEKNVGGPVVDFSGKVIGLANWIKKDGQINPFVISSQTLKETMNCLIEKGNLERPVLGVYYLTINQRIKLLGNLSWDEGALVYSSSGQNNLAVIKNSPADKAGIRIGDIILEVNGKKINQTLPLSLAVSSFAKGEEISLKIARGEEIMEKKVVLE